MSQQLIIIASSVTNDIGRREVRAAFNKVNANFTELYGGGGGGGVLDADLTALAALTGTNTIYYRSAPDTWTPVTIGSLLGFSGGTLNVTNAQLITWAGIAPSANVQTLLGTANFSAFRTSLGVAIGSDVQAYSAILTGLATTPTSLGATTALTAWADYTGAIDTRTVTLPTPAAGTLISFRGTAAASTVITWPSNKVRQAGSSGYAASTTFSIGNVEFDLYYDGTDWYLVIGAGSAAAGVAGSDTQVQFNDASVLAGDAGLTYNKTTDTLTAGAFAVAGVAVPTISSTSTLTNKSLTSPIITGTLDLSAVALTIGPITGTTTNDSAAAGIIGEYGTAFTTNTAAPFTITIAAPGVVTETAHGRVTGGTMTPTTSGALPTGLTAGTKYYVIYVNANTYRLATTLANAIAGTAITTSGTQSGTHTATGAFAITTATATNVAGISLTAGDWDVWGIVDYVLAGTSATQFVSGISQVADTLPTVQDDQVTIPLVTTTITDTFSQLSPRTRISLSATTSIYLVGKGTFSAGATTVYGTIRARRVR